MGLLGMPPSISSVVLASSVLGSVSNLPVGILEPAVAGYALRLYRHLGTRVGWWIVGTFCLLALAHLVQSWGATVQVIGPSISFDFVAFLIPFLLLLGLVHRESTLVQHVRLEENELKSRVQAETQSRQQVAQLVRETDTLRAQVAQYQSREKVLEDSAQQYALLFSHNPQPMWVIDLRSLKFLAVNDAAVAQYGYSANEFLAMTARELCAPEELDAFLQDVVQPAPVGQPRGTWHHRRKDGTLFELELSATDLKYCDCPARLVLAADISQRQQVETKMRQEDKLQAIARVVGEVAEQFERCVKPIATEAEGILKRTLDPSHAPSLKQISSSATQAVSLAQELLAAAGRQAVSMEASDLNQCLLQIEPQLRRRLGAAINLELELAPRLPLIMADARLVERMVTTLALNSCEAMPRGGTVSIQTSVAKLDKSPGPSKDHQGDLVCLEVRDQGCGLSARAQARLFEPFCSTKDPAKHLGLGLAGVYGAVQQLAGRIEVATETGVGTQITMYFPVCAPPAPMAEPAAVAPVRRAAVSRTILLVEPDDRMRLMARSALEWNGYRVIETDSSELALIIWPGLGQNADLLLTEVALPGELNGRQLAERLRAEKPGLKVLFTCNSDGSAEQPTSSRGFISKPFTSVELLERVSDCLPENV